MNTNGYICPVCKKHLFRIMGTSEICPICDWINDSLQCSDPNEPDGENTMTLNEYRKKWEMENKK